MVLEWSVEKAKAEDDWIGLDWRLFDGSIEGWFTQLYRRDHGELGLAIRRSIKDLKSAKHRRGKSLVTSRLLYSHEVPAGRVWR